MASQLLGIKTRFTNDLGSPLVGGQVYTYFAGTSTNQDSYSDAALTVPNTNPVILDDTGSADIFLKGAYRIRVFDKSGRFIEEQDNVTQAASQGDATELNNKVTTLEGGLYTANTEIDKVKLDTGITATAKNGTLPITQSEKNAQTISMVEYGATGDGTTDDTAAFELLEANVTGREIDLQGKTYKVNKAPTKNIYSNGKWFIGGQLIPVNGELITSVAKQFDVKAAAKDSAVSLYRMFDSAGRGGNRTMQSAAQDADGNIYTNHNTTIDDSSTTVSVWNQYKSDSAIITPSVDYQSPEDRLGSQGIAVLNRPKFNDKVFVTQSPNAASGAQYHLDFDYTVGGGYGIVLFKFKSNIGGDIDRPVQYRVLQANTISTSSTTPTITSDGKWLIIKYSGNGQNSRQYFRVFSTELLNSLGDTDISSKYTHEFSFVVSELLSAGDTIHSLSGFCSDGNHLYAVLAGYRDPVTQPKYLLSCDLLGNDIEIAKSNIFETSVQLDSGTIPTFTETEGMLIVESEGAKYLGCVVVSDTPSHTTSSRFSAIYLLGAKKERQVANASTVNIYEYEGLPNKPIALKVGKYTLNGIEQEAGLIVDNNGRGNNNLLSLQRNGITTAKVYSSSANLAITAPSGNHRLIFGATKHNGLDDASSWNWLIDPTDGYFMPYLDNVYSIGTAARRVAQIYAANGAINTSDERLKTEFDNLKAAEKRAALKIKESIGRYQFTDSVDEKGNKARYHFGVGAQTVGKILKDEGLDPEQYAFYCYDEWDAQDSIVDADGNIESEMVEAGNRYGIRYDELSMFILAAI